MTVAIRNKPAVLTAISDAFLRHVAENHGELRAAGHVEADSLAATFYDLACDVLNNKDEQFWTDRSTGVVAELAAQGLAVSAGRAMMEALLNSPSEFCGPVPIDKLRLFRFGLLFLEILADQRENILRHQEEAARTTLQSALHNQLQEQRHLRRDQEWRTEKLQSIMQLSADLARLKDEDALLSEAVRRITALLALDSATIFSLDRSTGQWQWRESTLNRPESGRQSPSITLLLAEIAAGADNAQQYEQDGLLLATRLHVGQYVLGTLISHLPDKNRGTQLLLAAFTLNLATHWRNLQLFLDSRQRTRELEILHGRYVDEIWQSRSAILQAKIVKDNLQVTRDGEQTPAADESDPQSFDLTVGDRSLGTVQFPDDTPISPEEEAFVQALVREMGSALNNARLLQATRSYSLQMQAAADVSRAISTMLDRETLMAEVVDLIGRRFGFPYVGLFILYNREAVLRAATGKAGETLKQQGYSLSAEASSPVIKAIQVGRVIVDRAVQESNEFEPLPDLLARTRSQLALPLRARGHIIGALDIHSKDPGAFTAEEMTVLQTLAEQVAVALDNASLFAQVQDSYLRVNQLYLVGRQINAATNIDGVFQGLVDYAATSRVVDFAFVIAPDHTSPDNLLVSYLWNRAGYTGDRQPNRSVRTRLPLLDILTKNEPLLIANGQTDPRLDPQMQNLFHRYGVVSCALLPMGTDQQWLGSMVLARTEYQPFNEETLQPFLNLCGQASVALSNQLLLRETNALYHISQTLNQALTIEDALMSTLEQVARYTGISYCRIILFDEETQSGREVYTFDLHTGTENDSPAGDELTFPMQDGHLFAQLEAATGPVICRANEETCLSDAAAFLAHHDLEALMSFPIRVQHQILGFLALDSASGDRPFTATNRNFAQNAVAQLTTFLENLSLFDEATKRAQDLIQLNQVVTRLAGVLDLNTLLDVLYVEMSRLLSVDIFFLVRYQPEAGVYSVLRHLVNGEAQSTTLADSPRLPDPTQLSHVLREGGVLIGAEAQKLADIFQTYFDPQPHSMMWVALQEENQPAGLIAVHTYNTQAYRETDQQLFRSIATQASLAITNARLFQRTQENVAEFRLLFTISQAAAARVEVGERLESMVQALHQGLRRSTIAIYRIVGGGDHLELLAHAGELVPRPLLQFHTGPTGHVARMGQPLIVNQFSDLPDYDVEIEGAQAQLSAPLNVGKNLVGVITVAAEMLDAFTERDLRLVETLSVSLAATIESTRIFANIQATNERLRELDLLKNRFLANMTHELRTPLNAIIGFSRVILKGIDGPLTIEQEEDLTAIHQNGQHLLALISDVLDLAKIEAGKIALVIQEVDIQMMVNNIVPTIRGLLHDRPVFLHVEVDDDVPLVEVDEIRMRQVLLNLLSNAAKYTEEGEIICRIENVDARHVQIVISDTGIGIDPADFGRLFRAFEQADSTARAEQGTGLGLPISKSLIEMHNGRIWFESELGKGTNFYVLLPVRQPADSPNVIRTAFTGQQTA